MDDGETHENESDEWYILEGMKATIGQDDWFKLPDAKTSRDSSIHTQSLSGAEIGGGDTQSSGTASAQNVLDDTDINQTKTTITRGDFEDVNTQYLSTVRLNLQESIDGVKSNSQPNSSNISSKTSLTTNLSMNDTNSLLREAQQSNWSSLNYYSSGNDGVEWLNLTGSNIQDINRPEPLGLAKNDSGSIGSTVPIAGLSTVPVHTSIDLNISDQGINKQTSLDYSLRELSTTASSLSINEPEKQPTNRKVTSLLDNDTQNFSSLASSMTFPSYKEISPKQRDLDDKPFSKLLGSSYQQTEHFLKNLKYAKVRYDSKGSSSSESEDLHSQWKANNNHNIVVDDEPVVAGIQNELVEQDIVSASLLDTTLKHEDSPGTVIHNTIDPPRNADDLQSVSSDAKRDSEEEMTLSELTVDIAQRKSLSSNSSTQASSRSRMPLEPIKEVFSPEHKNIHTNFLKSTVSSIATSDNTYNRSYISGDANSTSTPYNVVDVSKRDSKGSSRGIYDIRDSTSPGSSNRKRVYAGRQPRKKMNRDRDSFTVYVSEDSKLADSVISSKDPKKDVVVASRDKSYEEKNHGLRNYMYTSHLEPTRVSTISRRGVVSDANNTDELIQSTSTFFSETTSDTVNSSKTNEGIISSKSSRIKYRTSHSEAREVSHSSLEYHDVSMKYGTNKQINDDSATSNVKPLSNRETASVAKNDNLNELWQDFDQSFKQISINESPLLRKMELLSTILKKQMEKRKSKLQLHLSSDSSETSVNTSKDLKSFVSGELGNRKQKEHTYVPDLSDGDSSEKNLKTYRIGTPTISKVKSDQTSKERTCPYCKKRNVGTNCPTPCTSDSEYDRPLMLQTWTQTTSDAKKYITSAFTKTDDRRRRNNAEADEREHFDQKENDKSLSSNPRKRWEKSPENIEKNRRLLIQESKENFDVNHSQWWTSSNSTIHEPNKRNDLLQAKSSSREIACTAWFQTASSDVSEVIPLSKVPTLNEKYTIQQTNRLKRHERLRSAETMTLQEAFQLHKQTFIVRLKQRVQDVKNMRLHENHHYKTNERLKPRTHGRALVKPSKKKKDRRPRKLSYENSPREIHRHEAEKQALLRENRLRMKKYDCKIRQSFLRRKKNGHRHNFYVERH